MGNKLPSAADYEIRGDLYLGKATARIKSDDGPVGITSLFLSAYRYDALVIESKQIPISGLVMVTVSRKRFNRKVDLFCAR